MLDLMIPPIVAALVILSIHAYLGLHVIGREVIFVDLAFAQIAALGTTVGLLMGIEVGSPLSLLGALAFTLLGALVFSFTRLEDSPVPQEAIIGITYVVASAAVILLAGFTAEGAEHIKETLTGTLIWVDWPAIAEIAVAYALIGLFHVVFRKRILALTFAPGQVDRPRLWDFLFYVSFGIVISFSVEIAGVLMVFSSLVIPAVIAFLFTSRFGMALLVSWAVGTVAIVGGIASSFALDVATGPLLVCAFGVMLVGAFVVRAFVRPEPGVRVRVPSLERPSTPGGPPATPAVSAAPPGS